MRKLTKDLASIDIDKHEDIALQKFMDELEEAALFQWGKRVPFISTEAESQNQEPLFKTKT